LPSNPPTTPYVKKTGAVLPQISQIIRMTTAIPNKHLDTLLEGEIMEIVKNTLKTPDLEDGVIEDPESGIFRFLWKSEP
jgi:hypothetical protein